MHSESKLCVFKFIESTIFFISVNICYFSKKKILKAMPISLYDKCFCCAYFYFLFSGSYFVFSISKLLMLFFKLILTIKGIVLSFVLFNYMSRSKYGWFILFAVQFAPIPIYYSIKKQKQIINRNFGNFPNVSFKVILLLLIW